VIAMRAVVLLKVRPTHEKIIEQTIRKLPYIRESMIVFGEYDIVVFIEAPDSSRVAEIVTKSIRTIDGVVKTETLLGI